jgi:hypothetical protein
MDNDVTFGPCEQSATSAWGGRGGMGDGGMRAFVRLSGTVSRMISKP